MNVALHPESLDLISLCTGGGGLDLGVELALPDARSVVMVEREAFAVAHLVAAIDQGLLAPAAIWSDVRTFDGRPWRGLVDGLIGGIPCQPHSLAGRKQGSLDARDLWSDARRHVVTARPWFVLIENVAGMLAAGADEVAGAERVWRDLRKLGFAVEIGLFTAAEVGASHRRERIFILGVADPRSQRSSTRISTPTGGQGSTIAEHDRDAVADTGREGLPLFGGGTRNTREELAAAKRICRPVGDADVIRECQPNNEDGAISWERSWTGSSRSGLGLFPPSPDDVDAWRVVLDRQPELEPAVRRMADGVAARLDLTGPHAARVDRLRLLGNGVVSLEAAYAVRTLVTRLADRGAAGAAELARRLGGVT